MKKVLSTVAALGLVAGLASTAAAVEFKMSGTYLVDGAYLSDSRGTGVDLTQAANESTPSDAYFLHTFEIKPTMKVNDKISMASVIRLADDTIWGGQTDGDTEGLAGTEDVYVHHLYMDYASPIGKARFGRTAAGAYGTSFRDFDLRENRIMWWPSFLAKPWSTLFYLAKATDNRNVNDPLTDESDADSTKYVARVYYQNDTIDSGLHYGYYNDMNTSATSSARKQELTAYGKFKLDNYFINGELTHFFGEQDFDAAATLDLDYDSWGGMLQAGGTFDALTVTGTYFYAQGDDKSNDDEINTFFATTGASAGSGDLFEPLYILTGRHTGMLNNDLFTGNTGVMATSGVHAFVLAADYAVSNQLNLHGAIGYAKADEAVRTTVAGVAVAPSYLGRDDEYGWEYNVGAAYKLLDNLTYEAHFGYLDTGDFFKSTATTDDTENVYVLTHSLTMTF